MTIAFYLPGNIPIYAFSLMLGAGASLGLLWSIRQAQPENVYPVANAGAGVIFGSLLGARLAYLAVNWPYYQHHLDEIIQFPLGGLAWPGAVAGGVLMLLLAAALIRQPFAELADALYPLATVLVIFTWLACWLDGCAYGSAADAWWAVPARDEWGNLDNRVPVQLLGALLTLAQAWALDTANAKWAWLRSPGRTASFGMLGLSLQWWWLTGLRADSAPLWRGLHPGIWAAITFAGLSALFVAFTVIRPAAKAASKND